MKNIIKRLITKRIKRFFYKRYKYLLQTERGSELAKIPQNQLTDKHVQHLRVLPDRIALLKALPQHGMVAEIGVDKGEYSRLILQHNTPQKLYLIDAWASKRYSDNKKQHVLETIRDEITQGKVELMQGNSTDVVEKFPDGYFDWIYIDTDHSYELTKKELDLWHPKVKKHGIMAGHDFITGNWKKMLKYGVIEAVMEFCVNEKWEMLYLTAEFSSTPSFAIRRMK